MRKTQIGTIVSDKMQETAIVEVAVWKINRIIKKRYQTHKKFMAHNKDNQFKLGNIVVIGETKPLSRRKSWEILNIVDNTQKTAKVETKVKAVNKKK
jgi:small subunit ribosomal protein S17